MASSLVWVERVTPVREVAAKMCKAGVHRILVLDEGGQLYGIISAVDFSGWSLGILNKYKVDDGKRLP